MSVSNKLVDGVVGLAVGDALGVPAEFRSRYELEMNPVTDMMANVGYSLPAGTFSDDTSMTLATIDSIVNTKEINTEDMAKRFVNWYRYAEYTANGKCFDIGGTTMKALVKFEQKFNKASECGGTGEFDNGNGSLMRILPIAYYLYYKGITDDLKIYEIVRDVSSITHAHEISVLGCYIYIRYCLELLNGNDRFKAYDMIQHLNYNMFSKYAKDKYDRILNGNIAEVSQDDISTTGYVVSTLESVMWAFLNATDYNTTILKAINLGDDADTVGAILGGLLGMYYGIDSINPSWKQTLKRYDYIVDLCNRFDKELN